MGTGGGDLCDCATAGPGLKGTSGGVLLGFGGGATFCVSREGEDVFRTGGGGGRFMCWLSWRRGCGPGCTAIGEKTNHIRSQIMTGNLCIKSALIPRGSGS